MRLCLAVDERDFRHHARVHKARGSGLLREARRRLITVLKRNRRAPWSNWAAVCCASRVARTGNLSRSFCAATDATVLPSPVIDFLFPILVTDSRFYTMIEHAAQI